MTCKLEEHTWEIWDVTGVSEDEIAISATCMDCGAEFSASGRVEPRTTVEDSR